MSKKNILLLPVFFVLMIAGCSDDTEIDSEKPTIDIGFAEAFPTNCDTLYFGETFVVRMKLADNVELGAYSIDIHDNFDHHSHSTEGEACNPDPDKDPVNPYVFINDYKIPEGLAQYETTLSIAVPEGDGTALFDEGDYHFMIQLTDEEGWSVKKRLSIKMLYR